MSWKIWKINRQAVEILAEIEHEQWTHWTKYMLDNLTFSNIERWRNQIETKYADLSDKEKESDKVWARKVVSAVEEYVYGE